MNLIYSPPSRGGHREENKKPLRYLRLEHSEQLI